VNAVVNGAVDWTSAAQKGVRLNADKSRQEEERQFCANGQSIV